MPSTPLVARKVLAPAHTGRIMGDEQQRNPMHKWKLAPLHVPCCTPCFLLAREFVGYRLVGAGLGLAGRCLQEI